MSRFICFSLALPIIGVLVLLGNAAETNHSATFEERWYSDWLAHRGEVWKEAIRKAGQPVEGIVAEAFVTPREPEIGKPVMCVVSFKNLYERSATHTQHEEAGPSMVLMQDSSERPVPLREKAQGLVQHPHGTYPSRGHPCRAGLRHRGEAALGRIL